MPEVIERQLSDRRKLWKAGTLTYTAPALLVLFAWLLMGDFAWSMRDRSVGPMAQWYLGQLKISNFLFGLLSSSFPALLGLVITPIVAIRSDRHRSRWGRRIPFLIVMTPIAMVGMIGLALTPLFAEWMHRLFPDQSKVTVAVLCFGVFWTVFEFATIASQAVLGGLFNDVIPRELIGRFYGLFRAVSLIDGMIFNYWIIGRVPRHFTLILFLTGLFYGVIFAWVCFKVKEGEYPPPPPRDLVNAGKVVRFMDGVRLYFRECFSKRYYLAVCVMLMTASLCFAPVNIFSIPYARSVGMDMNDYGKAVALVYFISLCLSFFLGWLADLFHPLRMAMVMLLGYALATVWGGIFATTSSTFFVALVLHGVLSGCYFTSAASLGQRLFPQEKFAQFASAAAMVAAPANMLLAPVMGMFIDRLGNVYRYTFLVGCGLALLAFIVACFVYKSFIRLGGPKAYQAPF